MSTIDRLNTRMRAAEPGIGAVSAAERHFFLLRECVYALAEKLDAIHEDVKRLKAASGGGTEGEAMMLTEEQARTKWCPHVRYVVNFSGSTANRWKQSAPLEQPDALNPIPCRCIASECMQWRFVPRPERIYADETTSLPPHGYCGLAGRPED
jgi:hypothetical protein